MFFDKVIDGRLEVYDGMEGSVLQPKTGEFRKEALDGVQPGA